MDGLFPEHTSRPGLPSCPQWDVDGYNSVCVLSLGLSHVQKLRERTMKQSPVQSRDGQTERPDRRAHGSERQAKTRKDVRDHLR